MAFRLPWFKSDERAFMAWFWRFQLKQYQKHWPLATKLPPNYGASCDMIDTARVAYQAGFKRGMRI